MTRIFGSTRLVTGLAPGLAPGAALAAFAAVWLAPLLALASPEAGDGHGAEGGEHGEGHLNEGIKWIGDGFLGGPGDDGRAGYLVLLINFVVLLLVLNRLLFRGLRRGNAEASDAIRLELERATEARNSAESLLKEYETKLSALEQEVTEIKAEAERSAEAERVRILAEADEQAEKIRAAAVRAGEREAARRQAELEAEIVEQALVRAEAAIRSSFGAQDQRRLVDAWVDEVSNASL